jgi:hypothetical protein
MGMAGLRKIAPQRLTGSRYAYFEGSRTAERRGAGASALLLSPSSMLDGASSPLDPRERERAEGSAAILANIDAANKMPRIAARQGSCSWSVLGGPKG